MIIGKSLQTGRSSGAHFFFDLLLQTGRSFGAIILQTPLKKLFADLHIMLIFFNKAIQNGLNVYRNFNLHENYATPSGSYFDVDYARRFSGAFILKTPLIKPFADFHIMLICKFFLSHDAITLLNLYNQVAPLELIFSLIYDYKQFVPLELFICYLLILALKKFANLHIFKFANSFSHSLILSFSHSLILTLTHYLIN